MAARAAAGGREWRLALPLAAFFLAFFVAPLGVLVAWSFYDSAELRALTLAQYARFLGDRFTLGILWDTLTLGAKATLVCLVFGYPLAWLALRLPPRWQAALVFLVILPILTSVVVRTFAWIVMLGSQGVINQALAAIGLVDRPLRLLYTEVGVVMVLAQVQMPLMVLPIMATLARVDPNLSDASSSLGAGAWRTFWKVTVPLSLPGVVAGCILVYAACVTAFVTQTLIGGARLIYMPLYIYQQATGANNWPFAAAMSVVFMIAVLAVVYLLNLVGRAARGAYA
ncbi:MAG: ABC transporter permease [Burkholderiales bacterium]|nr:ABC transporter permease [Burkholderiales bacterium]